MTISIPLNRAPADRAQQASEDQGVHRQEGIPVEQPGQSGWLEHGGLVDDRRRRPPGTTSNSSHARPGNFISAASLNRRPGSYASTRQKSRASPTAAPPGRAARDASLRRPSAGRSRPGFARARCRIPAALATDARDREQTRGPHRPPRGSGVGRSSTRSQRAIDITRTPMTQAAGVMRDMVSRTASRIRGSGRCPAARRTAGRWCGGSSCSWRSCGGWSRSARQGRH